MIENYQEQKQIEVQELKLANLATIGTVYTDGVTLIFDGETIESKKRYKTNSTAQFKAKDRVYLIKESGTYIVAFPVGNPKR